MSPTGKGDEKEHQNSTESVWTAREADARIGKAVCLQHFGFSFAVVSSFLGWPTVKLKHYCKPLSIPLERAMSPTGERSDEGTSELNRIRLDRKRGRRAHRQSSNNS
ncbi:hypothetical protein TNCV_271961 [Trichonephila clavipes]|nr:hypothetical protein TNCV_271961 [Trichonephila clavipes]